MRDCGTCFRLLTFWSCCVPCVSAIAAPLCLQGRCEAGAGELERVVAMTREGVGWRVCGAHTRRKKWRQHSSRRKREMFMNSIDQLQPSRPPHPPFMREKTSIMSLSSISSWPYVREGQRAGARPHRIGRADRRHLFLHELEPHGALVEVLRYSVSMAWATIGHTDGQNSRSTCR